MDTKTVITLHPLKTWVEKSPHYPEGTLRVYCGTQLLGFAEPSPDKGDLFKFDSFFPDVITPFKLHNNSEEQILEHCEKGLKEFIELVCKKKSNLVPVKKAET